METQIISALISAGVAVVIFLLLHFYVEPKKEEKESKKLRLNKLYSRLYGVIIAKAKIGVELEAYKAFEGRIVLGSVSDHKFINKDKLEEIIYENLEYASNELIEAWSEVTVSSITNSDKGMDKLQDLIIIVVKEYNKLKKDLKLPYDESELKTGIPRVYEGIIKK